MTAPNSLKASQKIYCSQGNRLAASLTSKGPPSWKAPQEVIARATDLPGDLKQSRDKRGRLQTVIQINKHQAYPDGERQAQGHKH